MTSMHIAQTFISILTYINAKYNNSRQSLNLTCHGISFKFRVRIRLPGIFKIHTAIFTRSDSQRLKAIKDFQLKQLNLNLKQLLPVAMNYTFDKEIQTNTQLDLSLLSSLSKLKFIKAI